MKNDMIPVYCWQCGKRFEIEIRNVVAGRLFCSKKCEEADWWKEIELNKKKEGKE